MAELEIPEKLEGLLTPNRYKIMHGGRGGGKSYSVAGVLLLSGTSNTLRILCAREVQRSIKQSVHQLLSDTIQRLGLGWFYTVLDTEIRGLNGTVFYFAGLASNTVESIKSFEGADIVWVEEGQSVSKRSWDILIPTIRKAGSEIWVTFNPFLDSDDTYRRFVISPPEGAWVVEINYYDNDWFSDELEAERLHCYETDIESYYNIWEGRCLSASEMQYITTDSVREAMDRSPIYLGDDPLICGIDLARGGNDSCYIVFRRGMDGQSEKVYSISGKKSRDSMLVVSLVAKVLADHQPDYINVDEGSMGGPIVDRLNQLGWGVSGIAFGSRALDEKHYGNRCAEMWARMRHWIMNGGSLRKDESLLLELTSRDFYHDNKDRLLMEKKRDMKKRGVKSPDQADAFALTFANNVASNPRGQRDNIAGLRNRVTWDVNPLDAIS